MIKIKITDSVFNGAYLNASRNLPVIQLEKPRQYFQRWEETYSCRVRGDYVEFPDEETYIWFVLKYA